MMRAAIAAICLATALGVASVAQERVTVLQGGTLIDGTGRPPLADAVVVITGTRITAVGRRGQVTVPANANVIRLDGRTILPGLIDGHLHLRDWQVPMFLPYGITTIADIHNDTAWSIKQREALRRGQIKGPRLFVSGARITGPAGEPTDDGYFVRDVAEARAYVHTLKAAGVDYIKVDLTLTDDQLRAVIEEASAVGLRVLGHTQNIKTAVAMGMKHMEHTDTMARALLADAGQTAPRGTPPESLVDPKSFPPLVDYLVNQGVYVNPTLVLMWGGATERWRDWTAAAAELVKDPGLAFVPAASKQAWVRPLARARAGYANVAEFLRSFSEAGGKVLAATDTGCCAQIVPGLSLHYEMQMLIDLGIPPMKAIQGATLWAAEVIGQQKDLGSVEPGKLADLTIVEGNPLADIAATRNVRMVIKDGAVVDTRYDPGFVNPIPRPERRPASATLSPQDYIDIQQLYARYAHLIDSGDAEGWANTFTADGVFNNSSRGHDALVKFVHDWREQRNGASLRHWYSNLVITPTARGASGAIYMMLVDISKTPPAPTASYRYEDALVKTADGWRFASRVLYNERPPASQK